MKLEKPFILPQPFAWMPISGGEVIITFVKNWLKTIWPYNAKPQELEKVFEVSPFEIAKYPLTNGQYRRFIEAGGYQDRRWWTDEGWHDKEFNHWIEPKFWQFRKWNRWYYPVVGVSWYEAIAYCRWLSDVLEENIALPTEAQWQRAAQGDSRNDYAWGNVWEENRCNHALESYLLGGIGGTSPVTRYEGLGDSPFGVVDMTGNVWEYCIDTFGLDDDSIGRLQKVAHGGGWEMFKHYYLNRWVTDRLGFNPNARINYLGFRIARLPN